MLMTQTECGDMYLKPSVPNDTFKYESWEMTSSTIVDKLASYIADCKCRRNFDGYLQSTLHILQTRSSGPGEKVFYITLI